MLWPTPAVPTGASQGRGKDPWGATVMAGTNYPQTEVFQYFNSAFWLNFSPIDMIKLGLGLEPIDSLQGEGESEGHRLLGLGLEIELLQINCNYVKLMRKYDCNFK